MVIVWIVLNIVAVSLRWDPYPFILLNLAFSTQAAYAAPLILLAQNRQENRDRVTLERIADEPGRPRPTPNIWPENWPRCGWRSATSPRPGTTCAASWKTCVCYSKAGTWARFNQLKKTPTAMWIDTPRRLIDTAGYKSCFHRQRLRHCCHWSHPCYVW